MPVIAGLTATDESIAIDANKSGAGTAQHIGDVACRLSGGDDALVLTKRVAGVHTDIKSRPVVGWRNRDGWCFRVTRRHVGGERR